MGLKIVSFFACALFEWSFTGWNTIVSVIEMMRGNENKGSQDLRSGIVPDF